MAQDHRIYRRFRPWRFLGRLLLILLALTVFLSVFCYVWFKRYIVYTDTGLYLDVPWLEDRTRDGGGEPARTTQTPDAPELVSADPEITAPWEQDGTGDGGTQDADAPENGGDSEDTNAPFEGRPN